METRQQFTFYLSFYKSIMSLPVRKRGAAALAIIEYALFQTEPDDAQGTGVLAVLEAVRPVLDKSRKRSAARRSRISDAENSDAFALPVDGVAGSEPGSDAGENHTAAIGVCCDQLYQQNELCCDNLYQQKDFCCDNLYQPYTGTETEPETETKKIYIKENANGSSRGAAERGGTVPEADKETAKEQTGRADGAMQVLAELQRMGFSLQRNAAKEVGAYVARLGKGRVLAAVDNAAGREKRSWAYVRAILDSGGAAGADSKNRAFQLSGQAPGGLGTKAARRMLAQDTEEAET